MKAAVPDSLMDEIQQLQDTFGSVTGLAMVLTDQEGNIITRPTIPGLFYQEILDSLQNIERPFEYNLGRSGSLTSPAVLDNWIPGLNYVISPIAPEYGSIFYLWSGLFIEQGAKDRVLQIFAVEMKLHPDYDKLRAKLEAMPELSRERIAEVRGKLKALGGIMEKLLAAPGINPLPSRKGMAVSRGDRLEHDEEQCKEGAFLFKEATRLLPQASSRKELAARLQDVVMSLPFNPVSVFVFFQGRGNNESTYFSKGWTEERDREYAKGLETRYSPQAFLSSAIIYEAAGEQVLLECPMLTGNRFKGLLSVGFISRIQAEEWQNYIESLAGLAAAAMGLIEKEERYRNQAEVFLTNLRHYLQFVDAGLQNLSLDAANMAYDFARYTGLAEDEAGQVKRAGLLAPFEREILEKFGFFPDEVSLLGQIDRLSFPSSAMEKPVLPRPAQILAAVLLHISAEAELKDLSGSTPKWVDLSRYCLDSGVRAWIHEERLSSFRSFLLNREVTRPVKIAFTSERLLDNAALKVPKEEWGISPREEEVIELIVNGKTNKEIANQLFISEHTVKNHLSRIFGKMNVTDRSQIIALIYKKILNSERIEI